MGAQVSLKSASTCGCYATDLMLDGIYYKFANISLRRLSLLSLFIRVTYWAIEW